MAERAISTDSGLTDMSATEAVERLEKAEQLSAKLLGELEAERTKREAAIAEIWRDRLSPADWLFDGNRICGKVMLARFANLDWSKAWLDLGPSISGNLGPYWHVPLRETVIDGQTYDFGDTVHRLYPKVLQTKWAMLILHACNQARAMGARTKAPSSASAPRQTGE